MLAAALNAGRRRRYSRPIEAERQPITEQASRIIMDLSLRVMNSAARSHPIEVAGTCR